MAKFKLLKTAVTNQNYNQKEIKSRLNSVNACTHSFQNLLFSKLQMPKIFKIYNFFHIGVKPDVLTLLEK
jgi:hypothetical protein